MSLVAYRKFSQEADHLGIFRFVLTEGKALSDKNLDKLIYALDPQKHLIILDTNCWTFDAEKAKWFASLGGYQAQILLDSMIEAEYDNSLGKKGSCKRVIRALAVSNQASLEFLISTCTIKDRGSTQEFEDLYSFCKTEDFYTPILCVSSYEQTDLRTVLMIGAYGLHLEFWCMTQMLASKTTQIFKQ